MEVKTDRFAILDLFFKEVFRFRGDFFDKPFAAEFFGFFRRDKRSTFGEESLFERAVERFEIPLVNGFFVVVIEPDDFPCDRLDHIDDLRVYVNAVQNLVALFVNDFALFVHDVVVTQHALSD